MQELDDIVLLREYVERDSQEAFAALVERHVNKAYSIAMRHTTSLVLSLCPRRKLLKCRSWKRCSSQINLGGSQVPFEAARSVEESRHAKEKS